jgi:acyl carrier protein
MAAPSSYTEATLLTFMVNSLSGVAGALSLTTSSAAITQALTATERILGVSDVASLTDMQKLETIARWQAWEAAADTAATSFDLASSGDSLKLSQMFDQINKRLGSALDAALVYSEVQAASGAGGVMVVASIGGTQQPYGWASDL